MTRLKCSPLWLRRGAMAAACLLLVACAAPAPSDDLAGTLPVAGSLFTKQLFQDYSYLANSFGRAGSYGTLPGDDLPTIFETAPDQLALLAKAFALKARIAATGNEPDPEPGIDNESIRGRSQLVADLTQGKDQYPQDAARAQAEFDCWMLNLTVPSQAAAASNCRSGFFSAIAKLEKEMRPPARPAAPAPASFTVYFDFDSVSGDQLATLQDAIAAARSGGQSRIQVVGHSDTAGNSEFNQALSLRRAIAVKDALVGMGARAEAISVSGVGEADLAVPTPDGVRERLNRRAVITLIP